MGLLSSNHLLQLQHFFEKSVDAYPDNTAIICDSTTLSYLQLEQQANQLAHYLIAQGISPGCIVGIILERSLACYTAILALLKVGAAYVPIEVEYPDERINFILEDLDFTAVLISSKQFQRSKLKLPKAIIVDTIHNDITAQPLSRPLVTQPQHSEEQSCYFIYTSGTTGKPKGVEITHRSICHYVTEASRIYAMEAQDKVYQGFSLAFDASLEEVWMAFANGATLVACTDKDTRSGLGLTAFIKQHQVSVFSTVPTLLSTIEGELDSLRLLILGGESCSGNLINRWARPGLKIFNTYGPTESTVIATYSECQANSEITIGKPLSGYNVYILDDTLHEVANGMVGELCVGGAGLAKGYVNRPDLMAVKFIPHPQDADQLLYRTGDLAHWLPNGDIQFCGRKDDQVKIRGFRIELNEIETVLVQFDAISQAVVALHQLEQPTLVAYLMVDKNKSLDLTALKAFLSAKLPDYMMPAVFECMDVFPLLASGKIDRKSLPKPQPKQQQEEIVPPQTHIEKEIAEVWQNCLQRDAISVTADFFYDLGGHSLTAAKVVSHLRTLPQFASMSIVDLYENPNIRQLAAKVEHGREKFAVHEEKHKTPRNQVSDKSYFLCGIGQFFGCLLQYGIMAWQFLAIIYCYLWIGGRDSLFTIESFALYIGLFLILPFLNLGFVIALKWLLLGRVQPGEYPLWGWFYLRWWLVQCLHNNQAQIKYLTGTPLMNWYYRLMGANIGADCFIATYTIAVPDVVTLGDRCSINNEARLLGYVVEDGWLKIGTINIGQDCYVGARSVLSPNTVMEDGAILDDMSMVPSGGIIAKQHYYQGSPARQSVVPSHHITQKQRPREKNTAVANRNYGLLHYFAVSVVMMLYFAAFVPSAYILDYFYRYTSFWTTIAVGVPLASVVYLLVHYTNVCIVKRIIMPNPKTGIYPINSWYYLRQSMVVKLLDNDEIGVLADSIFFPKLLKLLGAKIGKYVEMGEAPQLIPDFLSIEEGGFAASGVAIAWPAVYGGYVSYGCTHIGAKAFIGNVSLLPQGAQIGRASLIGCMSIPPVGNKAAAAESYWLGSPPIYLPTRELVEGFSDEQTYHPNKKLFSLRVFLEVFRIILPTICSIILLTSMYYAQDYLEAHHDTITTWLVMPLVVCGLNLIIVAGLIALKWLIVGRIKPCIKPLWDLFIWRNDIREYAYSYFINRHLTDLILGTPFVAWLYRAMGAKIGKRVFINTDSFAEFDLITVGDDVCINKDTLIQTHLYEDRIFKLDKLEIKNQCNVGVGSMVLYNTIMEPNASLGSFSLLMKGESLPANTSWEGSPAQIAPVAASVVGPIIEAAVEMVPPFQMVE